MKKISILLFSAVMMVSLAACNGAKKTDTSTEVPVNEQVNEVATPAEETTPAVQKTSEETLKDFQAFAKEYAEAFNNIAKDPGKFTGLAKQLKQKLADIEQVKDSLTDKQKKEYQKALDLITKVNQAGK
jgi:hypothetical protein